MSTRASFVYAGPIHIYQETNSWEPGGDYTICISEVDGRRCDYNGDVSLAVEDIEKMHKQLGEFLAKRKSAK